MSQDDRVEIARGRLGALVCLLLGLLIVNGCTPTPVVISPANRKPISLGVVEHPRGTKFQVVAYDLTAPSAIAFVNDEGEYKGSWLVAESGADGNQPRIIGCKPDGTMFNVYPRGSQILPTIGFVSHQNDIYGPIGGMVVSQGRIFITHKDHRGRGVISALGFDDSYKLIVGDLPAEGDYGVTDIAVEPSTGRLVFAVGAATNSGVVGTDNLWVKANPDFCDRPAMNLKLTGGKFLTPNPNAGLFGEDNVETGPFQAFGKNNVLNIPSAVNGKPTAAIYSAAPTGGDLRVFASGIRLARGLAFDDLSNLFCTNNGMALRGSRPVKDDPDVLLRVYPEQWYGWPDYSADLIPINRPQFTDPLLVSRSGYEELTPLINLKESNLTPPDTYRDQSVYGIFPALSGAAKLDFVPANSTLKEYERQAIVALNGDQAPFATSGQKLNRPVGYSVVRVDPTSKRFEMFIKNTEGGPASKLKNPGDALERPIDVKFGPDGKLYVLDYGKMEMRNGRERITAGTGRLYILEPE